MSQTMIDRNELLELLKNHNCKITFTKVDGSERTGLFTLREDALPVTVEPTEEITETKTKRKVNENVVIVWDLDQSAWRSFRIDSLKEVTVESI